MDIITQGLLGGVLAQTAAKKNETKIATLIGVVAGLLADIDIFIYSSNDPLLNIEFHRHFTHSIFFIPIGAAIASILLWPFLKKRINFKWLYIYSLLGYSLSGVLDAFTSYGTHLFWPVSDDKVALNIISIIDPVFSLILLLSLIYTLKINRNKIARIGLLISFTYLALGFMQLQRAETITKTLISSRGHQADKHIVKPTIANLLLWRSVYIYNNRIYVDAVRLGVFTNSKIYHGDSVEVFSKSIIPAGSVLDNDIKRFNIFSDGYVAIDSDNKNILGDIRYSMLPTSTKPLWGIVLDENNINKHADYKFFRDNSTEIRASFINMLLMR